MRYEMKLIDDGRSAHLEFTRKNGELDDVYVGNVKGGAADRVLSELYDYHQVNDEFADDDLMEVRADGQLVGTFMVLEKIHIVPADENTKLAVQGVTKELPYRVAYDGIDGHASKSFATLADAAKYVKGRWQGVDYMDSRTAFHNDYGRFTCFGFKLADIGTLSGLRANGDQTFTFKEEYA